MASDQSSEQQDASPADQPEQKTLSRAARRRVQQCFERGTQQLHSAKCNHDYANDMFTLCVVADPGNLEYVESFLDNLKRKYKNNKRGARIKGFGSKGAFKKAVANKDWDEIFKLGPQVLKTNPWDATALRAMAEACQARHHVDVELRLLKTAQEGSPKDPDVNRHCALTLTRLGQFDQAITCWHRVQEARRNDPEPDRMIGDLHLAKTKHAAGMVEEVQTASELAAARAVLLRGGNKKETDEQQQPKRRAIQLTRRQELERAIADDPIVIDNYIELSDLLIGEGRLPEAKLALERGWAVPDITPEDRELVDDAQIRLVRAQLRAAEQRLAAEKTDQNVELVKQQRKTTHLMELGIFRRRCEQHPDDMGWKYELGVRLRRLGQLDEAIACLQEAREDERCKPAATLELGDCCQQRKQYNQALACFKRAIALATDDDVELKKRALYRTGVLASGLKDLDLAQKCLAELVRIDPSFRDASSRLDKIREIRDKE